LVGITEPVLTSKGIWFNTTDKFETSPECVADFNQIPQSSMVFEGCFVWLEFRVSEEEIIFLLAEDRLKGREGFQHPIKQ